MEIQLVQSVKSAEEDGGKFFLFLFLLLFYFILNFYFF